MYYVMHWPPLHYSLWYNDSFLLLQVSGLIRPVSQVSGLFRQVSLTFLTFCMSLERSLRLVSCGQTSSSLHFYMVTSLVGEKGSGDNPIRKLCSVHTFQDTCGMLIWWRIRYKYNYSIAGCNRGYNVSFWYELLLRKKEVSNRKKTYPTFWKH